MHARLVTPLDSGTAQQGELDGTVVLARHARWFHRGGQLRFNFRKVELPPEVAFRTEAALRAAESSDAPIKNRRCASAIPPWGS